MEELLNYRFSATTATTEEARYGTDYVYVTIPIKIREPELSVPINSPNTFHKKRRRLNSLSAGELQNMPLNYEFEYARDDGTVSLCVLYRLFSDFDKINAFVVVSSAGVLYVSGHRFSLCNKIDFKTFINAVRKGRIDIDDKLYYDELSKNVVDLRGKYEFDANRHISNIKRYIGQAVYWRD